MSVSEPVGFVIVIVAVIIFLVWAGVL